MLPTVSNPAVLDLEDEAAVNVQVLAFSLRAVVMNADHVAVIIGKHVPEFGPEGAEAPKLAEQLGVSADM